MEYEHVNVTDDCPLKATRNIQTPWSRGIASPPAHIPTLSLLLLALRPSSPYPLLPSRRASQRLKDPPGVEV
jgi:hypothetical protein